MKAKHNAIFYTILIIFLLVITYLFRNRGEIPGYLLSITIIIAFLAVYWIVRVIRGDKEKKKSQQKDNALIKFGIFSIFILFLLLFLIFIIKILIDNQNLLSNILWVLGTGLLAIFSLYIWFKMRRLKQ